MPSQRKTPFPRWSRQRAPFIGVVRKMREQGLTFRQIAAVLDVNPATAWRARDIEAEAIAGRNGRPRKRAA